MFVTQIINRAARSIVFSEASLSVTASNYGQTRHTGQCGSFTKAYIDCDLRLLMTLVLRWLQRSVV